MSKPIAVLLMAYGCPDSLDNVGPYLLDVRSGRPASPELVTEISERYACIGGHSPLLHLTRMQADALQRVLGHSHKVHVGMRHWHPYIKEAVAQIAGDDIERLIGVVMAPHFSKMSTGLYFLKLREASEALAPRLKIFEVTSWCAHPLFLDALTEKVERALAQFSPQQRNDVEFIFSAHSLPARIIEDNDPYPRELQQTADAVSKRLGGVRYQIAYQSAGRTQEQWLGPDVGEVLVTLASQGRRNVVIQPIGFLCDNIEILYDVDIAYKQHARDLGIHLVRAESLNDSPKLIAALADIVYQHSK